MNKFYIICKNNVNAYGSTGGAECYYPERCVLCTKWQFYYLNPSFSYHPLSKPSINRQNSICYPTLSSQTKYGIMAKDHSTAENRIEFAHEPMNHIVISLGFTALMEVRLLYISGQYIVMQLCNWTVKCPCFVLHSVGKSSVTQSVEMFFRQMIDGQQRVERGHIGKQAVAV